MVKLREFRAVWTFCSGSWTLHVLGPKDLLLTEYNHLVSYALGFLQPKALIFMWKHVMNKAWTSLSYSSWTSFLICILGFRFSSSKSSSEAGSQSSDFHGCSRGNPWRKKKKIDPQNLMSWDQRQSSINWSMQEAGVWSLAHQGTLCTARTKHGLGMYLNSYLISWLSFVFFISESHLAVFRDHKGAGF